MQIILLSSIANVYLQDIYIAVWEKSKFNYTTSQKLERSIRTCHVCMELYTTFLVIIMFRNCCNITWKNKLLVGNVAWGCKIIQLSRVAMYWKSFDSFRNVVENREIHIPHFRHVASKSATDYPHNLYPGNALSATSTISRKVGYNVAQRSAHNWKQRRESRLHH